VQAAADRRDVAVHEAGEELRGGGQSEGLEACPDADGMVAFVERRLGEGEMTRYEEHFASCDPCRHVLCEYAKAFVDEGTLLPGEEDEQEPAAGLEIGSAVGRYVVLDCLGRGAMGVVYLAHDPSMERKVALKLVAPANDAGGSSPTRARLLREARALAKLSHPNVVAGYDVGTHEGCVFVAMEYVEGMTLDRWLAAPRPLPDRLDIILQAGRGIAAAHAVGLVHRDLKPANIMVGDDGRVRVLDFGLARTEHAASVERMADPLEAMALDATATRTGTVLGTPRYMAPEQYLQARADSRSDQFSFAVTAFEVLYGERPFDARDFAELKACIAAGRIRPPSRAAGVTRRTHQALVRALSFEPGRRFAKLEDLLQELGPPAESRRRLTLAAVGVVAAAVAVSAWSWPSATLRLESVPLSRALERSGSTQPPPVAAPATAVAERGGVEPSSVTPAASQSEPRRVHAPRPVARADDDPEPTPGPAAAVEPEPQPAAEPPPAAEDPYGARK
jgi:serine/threonine protein kinase